MWNLLILIASLIGLWIGAELTIRGALDFAKHFKLSPLFVGLAIVALGTDLPELFIDISAAVDRLQGIETSDIIIGETMGTSMSQIGLILGIAGFLCILKTSKKTLFRDGSVLIGSVVILFLLSLDGEISQIDGGVLIIFYLIYLFYLYKDEKVFSKIKRRPSLHLLWSVLSLAGGIIILIVGSDFAIDSAIGLSEQFGLAQSFIGVLIVGLGTSLPELATTITGIRKKAGSLVVGNLMGSNIYDVLFTLGVGSAISGFLVSKPFLYFDLPALLLMSFVVVMLFRKDYRLKKSEAVVLLCLYGSYIIYQFIRII